ncbi:c-type cytochrome [Roseateles cellulosilyticus]|uniref:C-type cytochrome n=1 Tax=Pelomonas cellulosilytica TaxID=2906762 RepID=A0ABS8XME6_9BURK|nr:c-type cytochrome [Pelomonas sp. P8]MCE4553946.1 c-type cytochrome [Pelomonas sp. P8]
MPSRPRLATLTAAMLLAATTGAPTAQPAATAFPPAAASCIGCHVGTVTAAPRLEGLPADYLVKQLRDLRDGDRPVDAALGAAHTLDRPVAQRLAQWLAAQPAAGWPAAASPLGQRLYDQGDQSRGRPACQVCHGSAAGAAHGLSAPPLQGQPAAYLARQLHAWREKRRTNSPDGLMNDAAQGLTDAEIDALARHLGRP